MRGHGNKRDEGEEVSGGGAGAHSGTSKVRLRKALRRASQVMAQMRFLLKEISQSSS